MAGLTIGIGIKVGPGRRNGYSYDPDALDFIQRVEEADSAFLEKAVKKAVDDLVLGMKEDASPNASVSNWEASKSSCLLAGARTLAGALVPLRGSSPINVNFGGSDYMRWAGLKGDGVSKFIDTNRSGADSDQNNLSFGVFVTEGHDTSVSRGYIANSNLADPGSNVIGSTSLNEFFCRNNCGVARTISSQGNTVGYKGVSRNSPSSYSIRTGGASETSAIASNGRIDTKMRVFSRIDGSYSNSRISFYQVGEAVDLAAMDARITTFMTTIQAL